MKLDYRLIVLDDQILHVELGALRKHLSQLGEGAFDEGFLAGVVTGEGVGAHHCPVDLVGNLLKEGRARPVLESLRISRTRSGLMTILISPLSRGLSLAVGQVVLDDAARASSVLLSVFPL